MGSLNDKKDFRAVLISEELEQLEATALLAWREELQAALDRLLFVHTAPPQPPAAVVFEFLELLLPSRLTREELGDASEQLADLTRRGAPEWKIWIKIASTAFWIGVNALREVTSALLGKAKSS